MPIRVNLRPSAKIKQFFFWFLRNISKPSWKIEIVDPDKTITTLTDEIIRPIQINRYDIKYGTADAAIVIGNHKGKYTKLDDSNLPPKWTGGERLKIYQDYSNGFKLIFNGKINHPDRSSARTNIMSIFARTLPELRGRKISIQKTNADAVQLVKDLIDEHLSGVATYNSFAANMASVSKTINISKVGYLDKILAEIFDLNQWSGYWEPDEDDDGKHDLIGFPIGSKINKEVSLVKGLNITRVNSYKKNTDDIFTDISIIGKSIGSSKIRYYDKDDSLRSQLWRKDLEVNDSNLTTIDQLKDRFTLESNNRFNVPNSGIITAVFDEKLNPGEMFNASSQYDGIFGLHECVKLTYTLGRTKIMVVHLNRPSLNSAVSKIKELLNSISNLRELENPNNMLYSYPLDFSDPSVVNSISSFGDTEIQNSKLVVKSGFESGQLTSINLSIPLNVSSFDYILSGDSSLGSTSFRFSADGSVFTDAGNQKAETDFNKSGKDLKIEITLASGAEIGGIILRGK